MKAHKHKDEYLVYTRKSTDDTENQQNSIGFQVEECKKFCRTNNLPIADVTVEGFCVSGVIEEHHSAYKSKAGVDMTATLGELGSRRPKFKQLVDVLAEEKFKGVVILSWDRASRNAADNIVIQNLMQSGIDVKFVRANYQKDSSGFIHMSVEGMFAEHYSRVVSERVKDANHKLRSDGKTIHRTPIGYFDEGSDNKPIDPVRAPLVIEVFEKYATGEWSLTTLAHWANKQGLTTKPQRKRRTREEMLKGVSIEDRPKVSFPVNNKTIEIMLQNPFYIGYNVHRGQLVKSTSHQPLISHELFYKVQGMLKSKKQVVHYPHHKFHIYRGLLVCGGCGRAYSPYVKKGHVYYRSPCKKECWNTKKNISEAEINKMIKGVLSKLHFTDEELGMIEKEAQGALDNISSEREKELQEKQRLLLKASKDLDYLIKNRITMIRENIMSTKDIVEQEVQLKEQIKTIKQDINSNLETGDEMLKYVISFADLMKNAPFFFENALDNEKHEIVTQIFSELILTNGKLNYIGKAGFGTLLSRHYDPNWVIGAPGWIRTSVDISQRIYSPSRLTTPPPTQTLMVLLWKTINVCTGAPWSITLSSFGLFGCLPHIDQSSRCRSQTR